MFDLLYFLVFWDDTKIEPYWAHSPMVEHFVCNEETRVRFTVGPLNLMKTQMKFRNEFFGVEWRTVRDDSLIHISKIKFRDLMFNDADKKIT